MAKKPVKKKKNNVDGNTFEQDFDNLKFVQEYSVWKENCLSISGASIGVVNIPTLWDFLIVHVFENIRKGSGNDGKDGQGTIAALEAIEDIIEERELKESDIILIKSLGDTLRKLESSSLDPRLILFTEPVFGKGKNKNKKKGSITRRGHYRTAEYVKRQKKGGLPAVPAAWYSGSGNPPHWAIFGGNSTYAKPRGLVDIMIDISDAMGKKGEGISIRNLEIKNLKGRNQLDNMSGIRGVEKYFDQLIKKEEFWKGGRLLVDKVRKDFATQEFKATPKEQSRVRQLSGLGENKEAIAGTIRNFKFTATTALPIIDLVEAALVRAGTKQAGDGFRAWQNARRTGFDYRKTAREEFGEENAGKNPERKVIAKSWQQILSR